MSSLNQRNNQNGLNASSEIVSYTKAAIFQSHGHLGSEYCLPGVLMDIKSWKPYIIFRAKYSAQCNSTHFKWLCALLDLLHTKLVISCLTAKSSEGVICLLMELFRIICKKREQQKQCSSENGRVSFFICATGCWPNTIALCTRVGLSPRLPVHTPYSETTLSLLSSNKALCNLI